MKSLIVIALLTIPLNLFADETVRFNTGIFISKCETGCLSPIAAPNPIEIVLKSSEESSITYGDYIFKKEIDGVLFMAFIRVTKIFNDSKYLIQTFVTIQQDEDSYKNYALGSVILDSMNTLNLITWKQGFIVNNEDYMGSISIQANN